MMTAVAFAEVGHTVCVYDVARDRIEALRELRMPFLEPGLLEAVTDQVAQGRLSFSFSATYLPADVFFCCVGTPSAADGSADVRAVFATAERVAALFSEAVFVVKSTVPPGVCEEVCARFPTLHVASNPEFLAEGTGLSDARTPSRILFGAHDVQGRTAGEQVYAPWIARGIAYIATDLATASCAKYVANAFLATRISFMNEMSEFAEAIGADIDTLVESLRHDSRIGSKFLSPGVGFGGSCFPKDLRALAYVSAQRGVHAPIVTEVLARNERQVMRYVEKILRMQGERPGHVAVLGVVFKPGTNDVRFAPALAVIDALLARGVEVRWFDPAVTEISQGIVRSESCEVAVLGASCVFLATEWPELVAFARTLPQELVLWGRPRGTL